MGMGASMTQFIHPREFAAARLGSRNPQPLSPPEPAIDWIGVALNAPQWVAPKPERATVIPVCGYFMLPAGASGPLRGVLHIRIDDSPPLPVVPVGLEDPENEQRIIAPPRASEEDLEDTYSGGYFCFDLAPFIPFPNRPARIQFALGIRNHQSPIVTVEWRGSIA